MRKLSCLLLVTLVLLGSSLFFSVARAATSVSGLIASNTTWTASNSPYQLTGPVGLLTGVTLTIEPGVTVNFGSYYLMVNGTLNAQGTEGDKIYFTSSQSDSNDQQIQFMPSSPGWNDQTNAGSIIENAVLTQVSIVAKGCSPKIASSLFINPTYLAIQGLNGGSLIVTGNTFENVSLEGISVGGSSTVTGNLFNVTTGDATAIVAHDNAYVSGNQIVDFYRGVTTDSSTTISGNVIENCQNAAIVVLSTTANIEDNYIANNEAGISYAGGTVQNNAILNNAVGIQISEPPTNGSIVNNNIVGNENNSLTISCNTDVNVPNNWWGTTDIQAINQTIWDFKDDFNLGIVNFTPILDSPSSGAPTSPAVNIIASTTTPQPQTSPVSVFPNPSNGNATETSPVTSASALTGPQNPISSILQGSDMLQFATFIALTVVAVLLAVLIILVIRKRTGTENATRAKPKARKKAAKHATSRKRKKAPE